ncbi:alpha/beta fold hydrolase [Mycolicibacterium doricum]|nr:alpha/beta hydrolase [Mycolicibacterium doricum]MCV7268640.1 alpha/beta hydrolase [Mycolicibacterium doricum]ORV38647.1 hypothetical protein AWC01_13885 [Mycolicibacterium doricum]
MAVVEPTELSLRGGIRVWIGGAGQDLVLLHGAWAGAAAHWSHVWDRLAECYRVIAPDLPGLGDDRSAGLRSAEEYVRWCTEALAILGVERAWLVGNSFGAGIAVRMASQSPVHGLVLVNGLPPPSLPKPALPLLRLAPVRAGITAFFRRDAYNPSTLARAFADPANCPDPIAAVCAGAYPERLRTVVDVVLAGDPPARPPSIRTLVIWGTADRLAGSSVKAARRYVDSLPGSNLRLIADAGHLPQVERPDAFVETLTGFCSD